MNKLSAASVATTATLTRPRPRGLVFSQVTLMITRVLVLHVSAIVALGLFVKHMLRDAPVERALTISLWSGIIVWITLTAGWYLVRYITQPSLVQSPPSEEPAAESPSTSEPSTPESSPD